MGTAKDAVRRLLDDMPDDASLDEIQHQIIQLRLKIDPDAPPLDEPYYLEGDEADRLMAQWMET